MRLGFGAAGDPVGYCQHASCREEQARELAWMGAQLQRNDLRVLASEAHQATVAVDSAGTSYVAIFERKKEE